MAKTTIFGVIQDHEIGLLTVLHILLLHKIVITHAEARGLVVQGAIVVNGEKCQIFVTFSQ